jgi:hypothetical protein
MRGIVRYASFFLSLMVLLALAGACAGTWSRPYVRMEQDEKQIKFFMSHHGQVRWFSYRIFDEPWKLWRVTANTNSILVELQMSTPGELISSSGFASSYSFSMSMVSEPVALKAGYLPHWKSETVGRISVPGSSDLPAKQSRQRQIPYWPALALAMVWSGYSTRSVFNGLRKQRRVKSGLCAACAYDLRATPDCCPECGLMVAARG